MDYKVPGRLTQVTRGDGGVWSYHFDENGGLTKIEDPLGGIPKFVRNESGQVAQQLDPNGNLTEVLYNADGAAIAKVDPRNHRIPLPEDRNAPDPLVNRVAANAAEYEYGRLLNVEEMMLPDPQLVRSLSLSSRERTLVFLKDPSRKNPEHTDRFEVSPLGVRWWPAPKLGRVFNDLGKLVEQYDQFGRKRCWNYDASGNLAEYDDFDGGKWVYDYGSWHLLRGLTDPIGEKVRFTHTPNEMVASCVDAGNTRSEYRYDQKDQLIEVRRHGDVRDTYQRDASGNLVAKYGSNGRELLRLEVGPGNLPVKRTLASGDEHQMEYDESGRLLQAATKSDCVEYAYDRLGNCVLEKRNGQGVEHRYRGWRKPAFSILFDRFVVIWPIPDRAVSAPPE